ncbi:MAG: class I SAM-dependent methyltransferase [Bacteroidales bacterium]|nr:class I SAM-dependent methyltransferase [Bacteroidales bacterium]
MEECCICNSSKVKKILKINGFDVFKCAECGVLYTFPLPSDKELMSYYQGFLFDEPKLNKVKASVKKRIKELQKCFSLESSVKNKSLSFLDYGGGTGTAFAAAKELGLDSYYYDIDNESILFVKENFGLDDLEFIVDSSLKDKKFDYIWSDNVIEHVKNPIEFTNVLYSALESGGKLVIKTPQASNTETCFVFALSVMFYFKNALKENSFFDSLMAVTKHRFWHCEPPRHLYSFSKNSIAKIVKKCGIPDHQLQISDYYLPFFRYSIVDFLKFIKRPLVQIVLGLILSPFIILEFFLIVIRKLLSYAGLIKGTGLTITITK